MARRFIARISVWLKDELTDAEGETIQRALNDLGYSIVKVRVGKNYLIELLADSKDEAIREVDEICRKLLANPEVKDNYTFTIEEI